MLHAIWYDGLNLTLAHARSYVYLTLLGIISKYITLSMDGGTLIEVF